MHISEGVLSGPVLLGGGALAAAGTAVGLKNLDYDRIINAAMLAAAFFVASLIHLPIGFANAHLILNGIVGILLGWGAFPVILAALVLQAMFFQFGGMTTLGVNTVIMALPAVLCYLFFKTRVLKPGRLGFVAAFACGFSAVFLSTVFLAAALVFADEDFLGVALMAAGAHIPVMIVEGMVTAGMIAFLKKVQPEMLPGFADRYTNKYVNGEDNAQTRS